MSKRQRAAASERKSGTKQVTDRLPYEKMKALIARSGRSVRSLAMQLGYSSTSGLNRYLTQAGQGNKPLPYDVVRRLLPHLVGAGAPPITTEEVLSTTDVRAVPKPVVQAVTAALYEAQDGVLPVKYRVEPGIYIKRGIAIVHGASQIAPSRDYAAAEQFVTVARESAKSDYTQYLCVRPSAYGGDVDGKTVVAERVEAGDLVEMVVGKATSVQDRAAVQTSGGDVHAGVVVVGVVIGRYTPE